MKKKITALLAIFILIFTNYAFAYNETTGYTPRYTTNGEGGPVTTLLNIATVKDENTRIDARYTAKTSSKSQNYNNKDYTSNTSCAKINIGQSNSACNFKTTNKCYIVEKTEEEFLDRYLAIKLPASKSTITFNEDELYIIYKNGITYNGQKYDVKLQINSIRGQFTADNEVCFHVGRYKINGDEKEPVGFLPGVGVLGTKVGAEVDVNYIVQDSTGNEVPVNGVFVMSDIDLKQGIAIKNMDITQKTVYMVKEPAPSNQLHNDIWFKKMVNGNNTTSYIYTINENNLTGDYLNAYVTMSDSSKVDLTFTYKDLDAVSTIGYDTTFENYYKIETKVHNGTITESMYDVKPNATKTITYQPKENYYLKEIKVNGDRKSLTESIQNSYTFPDINSDNEIEVTYAKKLKVEFDSKGGSEVPTQHVIPREKATEPANPQKEGYTFEGWYIDNDCTTPYNFDSEVTEDKILYAKWKEIPPVEITHNIRYVVKGTPNDNNATGNPTSYKEGDTNPLTITNPTLEGYTFSGWFEREDLIGNPISSLSVAGKTEDITLYGKWNKDPEWNEYSEPEEKTAQYKVNHYLEDENGTIEYNGKKYKLDEDNSTTKTGIVGTTVSETARSYAGYNKTKDSVQATILEDGSTTLDFYYNKIKYTITFDSKGGTKVDTQTKNYEEKVDEPDDPTKDGYKFLYWYEEKDGEKVIYDFDTPVTSDKTLIAEWEKIKIIPDNPEEDTDVTEQKEEVPAKKTDTTTATKILPNTGIIGTALIGTLIVLLGAFFGIRYFKLRKDMK